MNGRFVTKSGQTRIVGAPYTAAHKKADRLHYLKGVAESYDVPLQDVLTIADVLGPDEDYDGLLIHVDELSDPGA